MTLVMLVLTCGMAVPVTRCTPETSLAVVERPVTDPLLCARNAELTGQTSARIADSGTYDKQMCLSVRATPWRPGMVRSAHKARPSHGAAAVKRLIKFSRIDRIQVGPAVHDNRS